MRLKSQRIKEVSDNFKLIHRSDGRVFARRASLRFANHAVMTPSGASAGGSPGQPTASFAKYATNAPVGRRRLSRGEIKRRARLRPHGESVIFVTVHRYMLVATIFRRGAKSNFTSIVSIY